MSRKGSNNNYNFQEDFIASKELRINYRIKISPIRLIGPDGEQIGIVPTEEALEKAREYELDLVEVSPNSRPPVCRILDYGKYKYELSKKDKLAKKKQHSFQLKEMRYRPKIDEHDYQFKTKHVREFIEAGSKVRAFVMYHGREMAHIEFGRKILDRVIEDLKDVAVVETMPKLEGRNMSMVLIPTPEVMKQLKHKSSAKADKTDKAEKKNDKQSLEPVTVEEKDNQDE